MDPRGSRYSASMDLGLNTSTICDCWALTPNRYYTRTFWEREWPQQQACSASHAKGSDPYCLLTVGQGVQAQSSEGFDSFGSTWRSNGSHNMEWSAG